jgi:hypothetical protein
MFLKNNAVGDVMLGELGYLKKSNDTAGIYGTHNVYTSSSFNHKHLLTTALIS